MCTTRELIFGWVRWHAPCKRCGLCRLAARMSAQTVFGVHTALLSTCPPSHTRLLSSPWSRLQVPPLLHRVEQPDQGGVLLG
jgi:hypothetical protein